MTIYEYKVETVEKLRGMRPAVRGGSNTNAELLETRLNTLAEGGWKVISVMEGADGYTIIVSRIKEESK